MANTTTAVRIVSDVISIANHRLSLSQWRASTVWLGTQWYPTRNGFCALELRNNAAGSTVSREVCRVVSYLDGYTATCFACGREFDADHALQFDGRWPTGICVCSDWCREHYEGDAVCWCEHCGEQRPATLDVDGNHACWLCASRAFRARYESERSDTIPCPPPTTRDAYRLDTTADAPEQFSAA